MCACVILPTFSISLPGLILCTVLFFLFYALCLGLCFGMDRRLLSKKVMLIRQDVQIGHTMWSPGHSHSTAEGWSRCSLHIHHNNPRGTMMTLSPVRPIEKLRFQLSDSCHSGDPSETLLVLGNIGTKVQVVFIPLAFWGNVSQRPWTPDPSHPFNWFLQTE